MACTTASPAQPTVSTLGCKWPHGIALLRHNPNPNPNELALTNRRWSHAIALLRQSVLLWCRATPCGCLILLFPCPLIPLFPLRCRATPRGCVDAWRHRLQSDLLLNSAELIGGYLTEMKQLEENYQQEALRAGSTTLTLADPKKN